MNILPYTLKRAAILVWAGSALLLTACGEDGPLDPVLGEGQYQLDVAGDVEASLTGPAFFGSEQDENGEEIFAILLGSDTSDHIVMFGVSGTNRPAAGTYAIEESGDIEPGDWVSLYFIGDGEELDGFMVADSGTVVLTRSDAGVMTGSVILYLSGLLGSAMGEVVVEGDFDARPAPTGS